MNAVGIVAYALAILFLLISITAAIQTRMTGRFSSGMHILPTIFAFVGTIATGRSWLLFLIITVLDLGGLFATRRSIKR